MYHTPLHRTHHTQPTYAYHTPHKYTAHTYLPCIPHTIHTTQNTHASHTTQHQCTHTTPNSCTLSTTHTTHTTQHAHHTAHTCKNTLHMPLASIIKTTHAPTPYTTHTCTHATHHTTHTCMPQCTCNIHTTHHRYHTPHITQHATHHAKHSTQSPHMHKTQPPHALTHHTRDAPEHTFTYTICTICTYHRAHSPTCEHIHLMPHTGLPRTHPTLTPTTTSIHPTLAWHIYTQATAHIIQPPQHHTYRQHITHTYCTHWCHITHIHAIHTTSSLHMHVHTSAHMAHQRTGEKAQDSCSAPLRGWTPEASRWEQPSPLCGRETRAWPAPVGGQLSRHDPWLRGACPHKQSPGPQSRTPRCSRARGLPVAPCLHEARFPTARAPAPSGLRPLCGPGAGPWCPSLPLRGAAWGAGPRRSGWLGAPSSGCSQGPGADTTVGRSCSRATEPHWRLSAGPGSAEALGVRSFVSLTCVAQEISQGPEHPGEMCWSRLEAPGSNRKVLVLVQ